MVAGALPRPSLSGVNILDGLTEQEGGSRGSAPALIERACPECSTRRTSSGSRGSAPALIERGVDTCVDTCMAEW